MRREGFWNGLARSIRPFWHIIIWSFWDAPQRLVHANPVRKLSVHAVVIHVLSYIELWFDSVKSDIRFVYIYMPYASVTVSPSSRNTTNAALIPRRPVLGRNKIC